MKTAALAIITWLALGTAWAQEPAPQAGSTAYYLGQLLISLLLVVVLIYWVQYVARRWGPVVLRTRHSGPVEVIQSVPLGGGHALHLVRVAQRMLMLGTGPGGVSVLTEVEADETQRGAEATDA